MSTEYPHDAAVRTAVEEEGRRSAALTVRDLHKTYRTRRAANDYHALRGVSLQIERGEFFTVLGPSGCGKSTLLRCVAGLESPDSGAILSGDRTWYSSSDERLVPTNQRGVGMVFQSYAVWPHMTVRQNVAYPLVARRKGRPSPSIVSSQVDEVLTKVQLTPMAERRGNQLSGGQQQRLAVARALVTRPEILLLDEPLSNLDARLRIDLREELQRLQAENDITMVYVTHDQTEALSLSSRVAVMNGGKVEQLGTPVEIYNFPATRFVADFVGHTNFLDGVVQDQVNGALRIATSIGTVESANHARVPAPTGCRVTVCIRPENFILQPADDADANGVSARVISRTYLGELGECRIRFGEDTVVVRAHPRMIPEVGQDVRVCVSPERCHVIPEIDPAAE